MLFRYNNCISVGENVKHAYAGQGFAAREVMGKMRGEERQSW